MLTLDDFLEFYGLAECRWTGLRPGEAGSDDPLPAVDDDSRSGGEADAGER